MRYVIIFNQKYLLPNSLIDDSPFLSNLVENAEGSDDIIINLNDTLTADYEETWENFRSSYNFYFFDFRILKICSYFQITLQNTKNDQISKGLSIIYNLLGSFSYTSEDIFKNYHYIITDPCAKFLADLFIISEHAYFRELDKEFMDVFPLYEHTNFLHWKNQCYDRNKFLSDFILVRKDNFEPFKIHFFPVNFDEYLKNKDVYQLPKNLVEEDFITDNPTKMTFLFMSLNPKSMIYHHNGEYLVSCNYDFPFLDDNLQIALQDNSSLQKYKTCGELFGVFLLVKKDYSQRIYHSKVSSFDVDYIYAKFKFMYPIGYYVFDE